MTTYSAVAWWVNWSWELQRWSICALFKILGFCIAVHSFVQLAKSFPVEGTYSHIKNIMNKSCFCPYVAFVQEINYGERITNLDKFNCLLCQFNVVHVHIYIIYVYN